MQVYGYFNSQCGFRMEICDSRLNAIKHFLINFDIKNRDIPTSEKKSQISMVRKAKSISFPADYSYSSLIDFIEGKQFLMLAQSISSKQKEIQLKEFSSKILRAIEVEGITKIFILYSHDECEDIFKDFRNSLKIEREKSLIQVYGNLSSYRKIYALMMK